MQKTELRNQKSEVRGQGTEGSPEWWVAVPAEEKQVVCTVMRMVRGLRRSRVPSVARAAARWECGLSFFIKARLQRRNRRVEALRRRTMEGCYE